MSWFKIISNSSSEFEDINNEGICKVSNRSIIFTYQTDREHFEYDMFEFSIA